VTVGPDRQVAAGATLGYGRDGRPITSPFAARVLAVGFCPEDHEFEIRLEHIPE
jgi:hypothetical protein